MFAVDVISLSVPMMDGVMMVERRRRRGKKCWGQQQVEVEGKEKNAGEKQEDASRGGERVQHNIHHRVELDGDGGKYRLELTHDNTVGREHKFWSGMKWRRDGGKEERKVYTLT